MTEIANLLDALQEHFAQEKREAEAEREKYYASLPEEDRDAARQWDAILAESSRVIDQAHFDSIICGYGEAICPITGTKYVFTNGYATTQIGAPASQ